MLLAIPSNAPGGLEATVSEHFGHSDVFTLVQLDDGEVGEIKIVANAPHSEGGCMGPVNLLKEHNVEAMLAGGMGARPLAGFGQVGIRVLHKGDAATVADAVKLFLAGECHEFGDQHTCGGHGHEGGCGHDHGHQHVEREPIDGPVEKDRVAFISFTVTDEESGEELDKVDGIGFVHGHGSMAEGLEAALEGKVAGDAFTVTVAPADGYGERDETRQIKVPKDRMPAGVSVGMPLQARREDGGMMQVMVVAIGDDEVTLDANHPLAGKTLKFDVKVLQVAKATVQDLQQVGSN